MSNVYESLPGNRGLTPRTDGESNFPAINKPRLPRGRVTRTTEGFLSLSKNQEWGIPHNSPLTPDQLEAAKMGLIAKGVLKPRVARRSR